MERLFQHIKIFISLVFCAAILKVSAQQHTLFSHYNLDHFMFNPGAAGSEEVLTANFFHRDQWTGFDLAPRTQFIDVHAPFNYLPLALGGHIYNDNEGFLNNLRFQVAPTYQFTVNEKGNLGLGLGLNLQRYQLKTERGGLGQNASTPDPLSDPTIAKYTDGFWRFHFTPGVYYNDDNIYGGISLHKIFEDPSNGEVNTEEALRRHWIFLLGYRYDINNEWSINPSLLARSERAAPFNLDINAMLTYNDLAWLNLGFRTSKMFMIGVGVNINKIFKVGYNYDAFLNPLGGSISRSSHEIFLGYKAEPGIDTDMDGVIDRLDKCPDEIGLIKFNGCPVDPNPEPEIKPTPVDTDKDGVIDEEDDCPNTAGKKELNGCPEPVPKKDTDNDGVFDEEDDCPNLKGTISNNGCPEEKPKDTDGDGIIDTEDNCPNTAGDADNNGCPKPEPVVVDTDGDGVIDTEDNCPNTAGDADNNGCPEPVVVDTDGDGVIDTEDNCPNTAGDADNNGCPKPEPVVVDTDGDGVIDTEDNCPNTAGDADNNGCPKPEPVAVDTDGDGVIDKEDNCPNTAGDADNNGCPKPEPVVLDSDEDGILDSDDDCPFAFGYARNNGCPDAPKPIDSDADGVPDKEDECPNTYGNNTNGCPEVEIKTEEADSDSDGVIDSEDECPNTYGAISNYGCPVVLEADSDGDGISDSIDNCPYVYGISSNNGCPTDQAPQTVSTYQNILDRATQNLLFSTGSANMEYSSYATLTDLADLMVNNPGFRLRIAGHTDNVGAYSSNMDLSRRRAEAVRDFLLNKGVSFGNMIVEYYGGTEPIADNSTPEGRKKNRRVDFELIEY